MQGRKLLTRRAKDRVVPYPRSHPCAPPTLPSLLLGGLLLFLLPSPPCPTLSCMDPPPRAARKEHEWRIIDQRKNDCGGPPSASPGRPFTRTSFTQDRWPALSAWSANALPALGRAPLPGPVSEIAH